MRIGFVYDQRDDYRALGFSEEAVAEFDMPETINEIEAALVRLGHNVDRIGHGRNLASRLVAGDRWEMVFSIAEGISGRSREAQVPALLELYNQPYAMSDPLTMATTLDKAVAKRIVRESGVPTAPFWVAGNGAEARTLAVTYPAFVKPVAEGTGKGCDGRSRVEGHSEFVDEVERLTARFSQPVLVESYLPGREFTVGIIGNGPASYVIAVMEIALRSDAVDNVYSFDNKERSQTRVDYFLSSDEEALLAGARALEAYRALGCLDAARIDMKSDANGSPQFLEANPIPGLHPSHSDLPMLAGMAGMSYDRLIGTILESASERYAPKNRQSRLA